MVNFFDLELLLIQTVSPYSCQPIRSVPAKYNNPIYKILSRIYSGENIEIVRSYLISKSEILDQGVNYNLPNLTKHLHVGSFWACLVLNTGMPHSFTIP